MRLDIDAMARSNERHTPRLTREEFDALLRIIRAAVAWRDARPAQGVHSPHKVWTADEAPLVIALSDAGL